MVDTPLLLGQIQNSIIAAKEAMHAEHAQPEFHFSVLLAHVRALPEEWGSRTKQVLKQSTEPPLEDLLQALSTDIESTPDKLRLTAYQGLLRFAIVIYALKSGHRSTGP
jgi:hypothetical protein